jgi:oxepin-CoA hydrolase/3-oxo-5,6-dehydrosuberyl-CoA semialdehyde dehydrogenase
MMMRDATMLASYARGQWYTAPDDGVELRNAVTGEPVTRISSTGLDMAGMLDHGRRVGGPALRAMTFHQRALLCKALAAHLHEHRDEFHALSLATGATRRDAGFDIDGGIITTRVLSSKARQLLPNDVVHRDGAPERLSRRGTFVGQHVYTSPRGVVVQINAFNFPVWGMLEKLAPALIAGVPTIVKPASQTAYLTELVVRRIIESDILPEGALQLICGSAGDLLDHLTGRDLVAFTGSATTAATLAGHPTVLAEAVGFNAERDSLNCAILGADAKPDSAEFDLYVDEVVCEITAKAGQRCTAIRRVIAPREHVGAVVEALGDRLRRIRVGDPADPATDMGALASHDQRDEVRAAVGRLRAVSELVTGDGDGFLVHGADADVGRSCRRRCSTPTTRPPRRCTRSRRSVRCARCCRTTASTRRSSSRGWATAAWWGRCSPTTRTSQVRSSSASPPIMAACTWSTATAPTSRRVTARRCPTWCTVARDVPVAARSSVAYVASCTSCSAPACRARRTW